MNKLYDRGRGETGSAFPATASMLVIIWAILGWLLGTAVELLAQRLAGEAGPACRGCGGPEPGPSYSTLARALGPAGVRCPGCRSWSIWWLAGLAPGLALVFSLLANRRPAGQELVVASLYATVLLLVAALDLRHRLVYPLLTYPATLLAIALTPLALDQPPWSGLAGALAGAGVFLLFYLLGTALYRSGAALGFGDVMVAGLVGAMTGFPGVGAILALGTVFGGISAALVGLSRRSRRAHFAYAPALCLSGLLGLLAGPIK